MFLVERFQNSNHMGSPKGPHFAVANPNTATDHNHGIDRLGTSCVILVVISCPAVSRWALHEAYLRD
jgi:hypothetical protein